MDLDLFEKGMLESIYLDELDSARDTKIVGSILIVLCFLILPAAFLLGLCLWENKYVCGISLSLMILLLSPMPRKTSDPKPMPTHPGDPRQRLTLSISWLLGKASACAVVIYILPAFSKFPFDEENMLSDCLLLGAKTAGVALVATVITGAIESRLKKRALQLRSERCTFAVMAHCLGQAMQGSPEIFSGEYDKHMIDNHLYPLWRRKYRYTYNGLNYIIFDQGERTDNSDMMIRIDPDEPEIYYEDVWQS
ncbi:MAG: hypothetical protein J5501_06055 [Ruminococcus sp.]|nr:hypothetical protein [Ruminococcus sp.]